MRHDLTPSEALRLLWIRQEELERRLEATTADSATPGPHVNETGERGEGGANPEIADAVHTLERAEIGSIDFTRAFHKIADETRR